MQLTKLFSATSFLTKIEANNKNEVFRQMAIAVATDLKERHMPMKEDEIYNEIIMHEELTPTVSRKRVAYAHMHIPGLKSPEITIATLTKPVVFSGGGEADVVVMGILPGARTEVGLKIIATMARFLDDDANRKAVMAADTPLELYMLLDRAELSIGAPIVAADVMRPPRWHVTQDVPLEEATRVMFEANQRDVPVVDDEGHILGIITTDVLFCMGMPEFFTKLKSISFIAEFDPFEKYFEEEKHASAKDVMVPATTIPPDYTILEVVFDLVVRKIPHLFVVDEEGRWIGTVGHSTVLDNIIRF